MKKISIRAILHLVLDNLARLRYLLHLVLDNLARLRYLLPNAFICLFFIIWLFLFYAYKLYRHITSPIWKLNNAQFRHKRSRYSPADYGLYNSSTNHKSTL